MSDLVGNPEDRFSRVAAQTIKMGKSIRQKRIKLVELGGDVTYHWLKSHATKKTKASFAKLLNQNLRLNTE